MESGEDSHLFEVVSLNSPLDAAPMAPHGIGRIAGCSPTREKKKMAPRKHGSNLRFNIHVSCCKIKSTGFKVLNQFNLSTFLDLARMVVARGF